MRPSRPGVIDASEFDGECGGEQIRAAVESRADEHSVVFVGPDGPDENGSWLLSKTVELPSQTTLLLSGARLALADGTNDNVIRNRDFDAGNEEVHVVGLGEARIDGNAANQERQELDRLRHNYGIHLYNVENVSLSGFTIGPTNAFAITVEAITDGRFSDISFAQDGATGNQDGIHVLGPAARITINGLTGTLCDDVVAASSPEGSRIGYGDGGPVTGITVTNVSITNLNHAGLLRTVAARDCPVDGIYASNLCVRSEADDSDAVLKFGWFGEGVGEQPGPEDHGNVVVDGIWADRWDGPYCVVKSPITNLTIRGARGRHTGPFFYNLENDVKGLTLEDCRTTLIGSSMLNGLYRKILARTHPVLTPEYRDGLSGELLDAGDPGVVSFSNAAVTDVRLSGLGFTSDRGADASDPVAIRVYESATIDGFLVSDVTIDGFGTGVRVAADADTGNVRFESVRQSVVATPWDVDPATATFVNNRPERYRLDTVAAFDGGEVRTFSVPRSGVDRPVAVDFVPLDGETSHGYRVESIGYDPAQDTIRIDVRETAEAGGGTARITVR